MPKIVQQKFAKQKNEVEKKYGLKCGKLDDIGTLLWNNPSLSSCYSSTCEGTHDRMPGIKSSLAATLAQNTSNLGEVREENNPIYFEENNESSEGMKKFQRNKISTKLQQKSEKQRRISGNYESIVSIKRPYKRLIKDINYDPVRSHNTKSKNETKKSLTPLDSLHYGLALRISVHERNLHANVGSPHTLILKNENSLESDIKIEPIDIVMSEDVIKSEDIKNFHHQKATIKVSPVQDKKISEAHSTSYVEDVNKKQMKYIKPKKKHKHTKSKLAKKKVSTHPKPIKQIFIYNNSENLLNEASSDCETPDNSYNQIPERMNKFLSTQNIYNNANNLLSETVDALKSDCDDADNSSNQIPETTSKILSSTQNIYNNIDNLLNETVDALESDNSCETADNRNYEISERTNNILSSTRNEVAGDDHCEDEIRWDLTKTQIPYHQHQDGTNKVFIIQAEKITESYGTENIEDVNKNKKKSIKYKTKHKQTKYKLAKSKNSENLLNEPVDALKSDCDTADNSNNQIPEMTNKTLSSTQNEVAVEKRFDEILNFYKKRSTGRIKKNNYFSKALTSSWDSGVISSPKLNVCTLKESDISIRENISVRSLENAVANNSDLNEKYFSRRSSSETFSVGDNCIVNLPVESDSQSFANCNSKEDRVRRTHLFHSDVNEKLPNKYVNVTIKPFAKQKDNSNIILEIDRVIETLINLRQFLTVDIIKSN